MQDMVHSQNIVTDMSLEFVTKMIFKIKKDMIHHVIFGLTEENVIMH